MKKGFTLIELLAVIVILSIIASIAIPITLNIINNVKISSTEQTINNIIDSLKQSYARLNLTEPMNLPVYIKFGDVDITKETSLENLIDITNEIEVAGILPTRGVIILNKDGRVELGKTNIKIDGYTCLYKNNKITCSLNPVINESCFTFSNGTITNYDEYCGPEVVIPEKINGVNVTMIGDNAFKSKGLISIDFSQVINLRSIESSAFFNNNLTSLDLSKNLNLYSISSYAFAYNKIKKVDLSKNEFIHYLSEGVFANNEIETYKFSDKNLTFSNNGEMIFNNNKLSDEQAFIYGRNSDGSIDITTIVSYGGANKNPQIPSTVETIGDRAFQECKLEGVDFSQATNLTKIGFSSFYINKIGILDLSGLTKLETIERSAFERASLTEVNLSGCTNLKTISNAFTGSLSNFEDANKITTLNFSGCKSLETIEYSAFWYNSIREVDLSECTSLTKIGQDAFYYNSISKLSLPTSITTIGYGAFDRNYLTEIDISNCSNLISIESGAFKKNSSPGISNPNLSLIKTNGKEFDWNLIINRTSGEVMIFLNCNL